MIKHKFKKELKNILFAMGIGTVFSVGVSLNAYSNDVLENISNEVVRFHVLANSDEDYDQELKIKVKDAVLEEYKDEISTFNSRFESLFTFYMLIDEIEEFAQSIVYENGYNYDVKVTLGKSDFPTKTYGNVTLPEGEYTALRIEIGEARGQNWWCVMFPPLCFVDESMEVVPTEVDQQLQDVLGEEEYKLVTNEDDLNYQVKFKVVEIFQ